MNTFQRDCVCSAKYNNTALTITAAAPQYIPVLGDIQVGHSQSNTTIHSPARALMAEVEEASQLLVIRGGQTVSIDYKVFCQVLRIK